MTRDQMFALIDHSLGGASTKAPLENLEGLDNVSRQEVEEFYALTVFTVKSNIDRGNFDLMKLERRKRKMPEKGVRRPGVPSRQQMYEILNARSLQIQSGEEATMKTVYRACDGEIFEDRADAVDHEGELFYAWLDTLIEGDPGPSLSTVVRHFNDSAELTCERPDEHFGTPWDLLKEALKTYWEGTMPSISEFDIHPKRESRTGDG